MKKFGCAQLALIMIVIVALVFGLLFFGINNFLNGILADKVLEELPKYTDSEAFETNDKTDYLNYTKYFYGESVDAAVSKSEYLKKLDEENRQLLEEQLTHYEEWVETKAYEGYDFTRDIISENDRLYIENKETFDGYSGLPDKFSAYSIYFFDAETRILYYMHYNI